MKHTGDGLMARFRSASQAVACALRIQAEIAEHNRSSTQTRIRVRIGLNTGEPVEEEGDLFGTSVQLAARLCGSAEPETTLV